MHTTSVGICAGARSFNAMTGSSLPPTISNVGCVNPQQCAARRRDQCRAICEAIAGNCGQRAGEHRTFADGPTPRSRFESQEMLQCRRAERVRDKDSVRSARSRSERPRPSTSPNSRTARLRAWRRRPASARGAGAADERHRPVPPAQHVRASLSTRGLPTQHLRAPKQTETLLLQRRRPRRGAERISRRPRRIEEAAEMNDELARPYHDGVRHDAVAAERAPRAVAITIS
jgi:hypothetical protein